MPPPCGYTDNKCRSSRRRRINTTEQADKMRRRNMVSPTETQAEYDQRMLVVTDAAHCQPHQKDVKHFIWSKKNISKKQTNTMTKNVDKYLGMMKASRPVAESKYKAKALRQNEIPYELGAVLSRQNAPIGSIKLVRAFDKSDYYHSRQAPLSSNFPDCLASKAFLSYLHESNEKIPSIFRNFDKSFLDTKYQRKRYMMMIMTQIERKLVLFNKPSGNLNLIH